MKRQGKTNLQEGSLAFAVAWNSSQINVQYSNTTPSGSSIQNAKKNSFLVTNLPFLSHSFDVSLFFKKTKKTNDNQMHGKAYFPH